MQVKKMDFFTWPEAMAFAKTKIDEGYTAIRIYTSTTKLRKTKVPEGKIQVRYWAQRKDRSKKS